VTTTGSSTPHHPGGRAGEEPAGFTLCEVVERGGRVGWIWQVGVTPRWRPRGVATALLCAAAHACRAEGLPEAGLLVEKQHVAARRVYARLGFRTATRETIYERHAGRSEEPGAREARNRT
jgi:ribosomal protein S18 acetylase RimI-like enzyme